MPVVLDRDLQEEPGAAAWLTEEYSSRIVSVFAVMEM